MKWEENLKNIKRNILPGEGSDHNPIMLDSGNQCCSDSSKMLLGACWIQESTAFLEHLTRFDRIFGEFEQHRW